MILKTNNLIQKIKQSDKKIVFCGASSRTKYLLENFKLQSKCSYIFDNFSNEKSFLDISIINYKEFKTIENKLAVICGNHIADFYAQIKNLDCEILIEFSKLKEKTIFPKNFVFEVESYDSIRRNKKEARSVFVKKLIAELLLFNEKIEIKPLKDSNETYTTKRVAKKNSFLFSDHGIGDKHIGKIHTKDGYFYDLITYDDMGYSGWSSLCKDEKEIEKIKQIDVKQAEKDFLYYNAKYIDRNRSKYEQPDIDDVLFPKKFVFIPLQIFTDSVMAKSYFEPMEWFQKTVEFLSQKNINIVIKRHPRCYLKEVEAELEKLKNQKNINIYSGSIHQAISKCSAVYTINSGSGFEALFHLKPVVTFGEVDYQSATFNIKDFKELEANPIPVLSEEKIIYIKQFLSYYMREKNININSKKSIEKFVDSFVLRYLNSLLKDNKI
ncbi:hypothetical protein Q6A83_05850 [Aliarcobacter skirrowii]|uniref:capsular polysaccharide export protein, LipB/KpsS family n=1 Tax=Aliarcobacter skirrowii TaxID=28200 RepID=UPI0029A7AD54|nr:hypothetical protein [Aliarcobacter skirrowii]MDX4050295.1 hypothetical protein [Aliarcobacter skirrowii]